MTQTASYNTLADVINAKRGQKSSRTSIGKYEIIADGQVTVYDDLTDASLAQLVNRGRLYKVVADVEAPNGFRRVDQRPLTLDVAWENGVPCLLRVPSFGL